MSSTYYFHSTVFHNIQKSCLIFNISVDFLEIEHYCSMLLSIFQVSQNLSLPPHFQLHWENQEELVITHSI